MIRFLQTLLFCTLLSSAWAQNFAILNDTLFQGDAFFSSTATDLMAQREALLLPAPHATFWEEFSQKFSTDLDARRQHRLILQESNADKWEMKAFEARRKQAEYYKSHPQFSQLSDEFKQWVEAHIRYNYWHLVLAYPVVRANADPTLLKIYSLPSVMLENLDTKKVSDDKLLTAEPYRHFLHYYVTYFNSRNRQFDKYKDMGQAMNDKAAFAAKYLTGNVQKYYLTRLIFETCQHTPAAAIKQTISQLAALPQSGAYVEVAKTTCADALNRKEEPPVVAANLKSEKSGYELLGLDDKPFYTGSLKGKVVYVDFWASWCGPCRKEFPFSKELHKKLTDEQQQKIVFLYISIDQSLSDWRKAVTQLQLEGLNGWDQNMIYRKLNIDSIPRYMIIGPKGDLVNPNAPRPSDPNTLQELLKWLE